MTDKKYSVTLSAKENLSATFESAGSASARFRKEIDETNKQIKQLGDTSKRSADLGSLRKEMDGTKGALAGAKEEAGKALRRGLDVMADFWWPEGRREHTIKTFREGISLVTGSQVVTAGGTYHAG